MHAEPDTDTDFPIHVRDPASYRRGPVFLADLVALGPFEVSPRTVFRATCTIAHRFRAVEPEVVVVGDRFTARIGYADGETDQVEYILHGGPVGEGTIDRAQMNRWEPSVNLVLVSNGRIKSNARWLPETFEDHEIVALDLEGTDDVELSTL